MTVVRTSNVDLKVNGNGAYAFVAQPERQCPASWARPHSGMVGH